MNLPEPIDALAIAAHRDDVEPNYGGTSPKRRAWGNARDSRPHARRGYARIGGARAQEVSARRA
jgi:hypothetical protein